MFVKKSEAVRFYIKKEKESVNNSETEFHFISEVALLVYAPTTEFLTRLTEESKRATISNTTRATIITNLQMTVKRGLINFIINKDKETSKYM